MGINRYRARHPWVYVALTAAFAGLAGSMLWAYPRWRWLGELPSRAEILAETVSGRFPGLGLGGTGGIGPGGIGTGVIRAGGIPQPAMANVEKIFRRETDWLLACLTETGTFALAPGSDRIIPYFGNQAAVALLPEHPDKVKGHLEWYLSHLNRPDRWRLPGTVYDYTITAQGEMPTGSYDSADAYAATFLTAVARYWQATGDTQFVTAHRDDLDLVAGVLVTLQDSDGLMWARPGHWVKYLMDNSENFQGLQDYAWLLGQLGDRKAATYWGERAEAVRLGIKQVMYRP
ncbi:MAG TPA: hypothetical protein GX513_03535, partial [Firmicutes bacterium]|nr:hypothetical protein [Bacillota bacterium]